MAENETSLNDIAQQLEVVIKLLASNVGSGMSLAERAPILQRAGLNRQQIAAVCNSSAEAVSVRLAEAKKKGKKRKR